MKRLFLAQISLLILMVVSSCHTGSTKNKNRDSIKLTLNSKTAIDSEKNDSIAIAKVTALPEFNNISKWFRRTNKDTAKRVGEIIDQEPDNKFKYYSVRVGVDGPLRFENLEYFYVDARTLSVSHLDLETDSVMSLGEWRKSGKDNWQH
jgi:hypothetical protein